jgi:hypothetical protein
MKKGALVRKKDWQSMKKGPKFYRKRTIYSDNGKLKICIDKVRCKYFSGGQNYDQLPRNPSAAQPRSKPAKHSIEL